MSPTAAAVQGACPSVHRPFHQLDGELLRVRLPGGRMTAGQGLVVAELGVAVGATLELTGRANLQLRGLDAAVVPEVLEGLVDVGLVHADPRVDERRNLMASPTAGFDPDEVVDVGPLVAALHDVLTRRSETSVPPTFGVLVDGGGRVHLRGRPHDIAFGAVRAGGEVAFELRLDGALPITYEDDDRIPLVRSEELALVLATLIDRGGSAGLDSLPVHWCPMQELEPPPAVMAGPPLGILPQCLGETVALGVMPVLGRLAPADWGLLAQVAADHGRGELRLSPWRSVVVPGVSAGSAGRLLGELEAAGFVVSGGDPAAGVVACIGSRGCPAGLTDALADARTVIDTLRRDGRRLSVHVSGCEKRCAGRRVDEHEVTFVGGPETGHYRLWRGDGRLEPGDISAGSLGGLCYP